MALRVNAYIEIPSENERKSHPFGWLLSMQNRSRTARKNWFLRELPGDDTIKELKAVSAGLTQKRIPAPI